MRKWLLALGILGAYGVAACGIGPKQDDPADPAPEFDTDASSTGSADTSERNADSSGDPAAATEGGTDATSEVTDAARDALGDACPDGGLPLTAYGPWNDGKGCYKAHVVMECVAAFDGGTSWTCFARTSTGDLYLAQTTQIPSGSDYRACTDAERARIKPMPELCTK